MRWLWRSPVFWIGGFVLGFLLWAWWKSWRVSDGLRWMRGNEVVRLHDERGELILSCHEEGTLVHLSQWKRRWAWERRKVVGDGMLPETLDLTAAPGPLVMSNGKMIGPAGFIPRTMGTSRELLRVRHAWVVAAVALLWASLLVWRGRKVARGRREAGV